MKLLLDLSSLKWFLLHLESVDGPCDHFHRSFCVGMSIFSSKASSGPPTWGRRGWSVILSTYSLQRQGLAFDFSGPGIGWGGDEVLWAHRRQVRPLISSFSVTFFFFFYLHYRLSIAVISERYLHYTCCLFLSVPCSTLIHTHTHHTHTHGSSIPVGMQGTPGPMAYMGTCCWPRHVGFFHPQLCPSFLFWGQFLIYPSPLHG